MSSRKSRDGKSVVVVAPSGGVSEGEFYLIDGIFGLAMSDADEGDNVALNIEFCHYETNAILTTDAFAKGDKIYWDDTNSRFTTIGASGLPFVGIVTTAKDSDNVIEFILISQSNLTTEFIQMPLQADSTASDVAGVVVDLNLILDKLITSGLMASS